MGGCAGERPSPPRGSALASPTPMKPEELNARSYADRLILEQLTDMDGAVKLSELAERLSGRGLGLASVRSLLASNPDRFAYHERRWIPAARLQALGRPVNEAIALVLHRFGGPVPVDLVVTEVARIKELPTDKTRAVVERILRSDDKFFVTPNGLAALGSFSFIAKDETFPRALALNGVKQEEVDALRARLGDFDFRAPGATQEAVRKLAPVSVKVLGALAYTTVNSPDPKTPLVFDSRKFFADVLDTEGYVLSPDGTMTAESEAAVWVQSAIRLAEKLTPLTEVDDAAPLEIKTEDIDDLVAKILGRDGTTTGTKILEENYEITPGTKTFPDDLKSIVASLKADDRLVWVGGDRFRPAGSLPEGLGEVPEPFQFTKSDATDEDGEPVDFEVTDDGLSTSLRKLLQHPLAMDVLDEDIQPAPKTMTETLRLVLKSLHRELGTFPLSQIPTGFFDAEPTFQELIVIDEKGREHQIWLDHKSRLLTGWLDLWYEQPIESGAAFTLAKAGKPNVYDFAWAEGADPVVHIAPERMEGLRAIAADAEGKSTFELIGEVMAHWPKGADFLTILAEINVVRRSSRRLVASILSSYQAFSQRSGSPVWHFDAKKVELGKDKTKLKYVKK